MGSRFSTRRAFLPILVLAGFTLVQAAGIPRRKEAGRASPCGPGRRPEGPKPGRTTPNSAGSSGA